MELKKKANDDDDEKKKKKGKRHKHNGIDGDREWYGQWSLVKRKIIFSLLRVFNPKTNVVFQFLTSFQFFSLSIQLTDFIFDSFCTGI